MSHAYADSFFQDCPDQNIDAMWDAYADSFRIEELESENAKLRELGEQYETVAADYRSEIVKLREQVATYEGTPQEDVIDYLRQECIDWEDRYRTLAAENEKLRELVRDIWRFTGAACRKYPRLFDPPAQGPQMVQLNALDAFEQRMCELGVEVAE